MARRIVVEFLGDDRSLSKTAGATESRLSKMQGRFEKVGAAAGKVLAGGLLAGGAAAVKLGNQASDLAETQAKTNEIFGTEGAAALDKFAGAAAKNLGQSKQAALDGAATFGMFGKMAGLAGQDLVGFSTDMSTLASDMASFNNTSPEEAVEAIGAALRGESEPIRRYGVLLDDATLRNEAMRMGLIKTTKQALTPQQKVLAAQAAIMKQTTDQQGDFARTSDGLANKQRILKAQLANLGTEIGAKVLPAMVSVTGAGLKMIEWVDRNRTTVGVFVVGLTALVTTIWAVSAAIKAWAAIQAVWNAAVIVARNVQLAWNIAMMANPIGLVIVAIVGLIAVFVLAYKKSETFRKIVNGAFAAVTKAARATWNWIKGAWPKLASIITAPINLARRGWGTALSGIRTAAQTSVRWIRERFNDLVGFFDGLPGRISRMASGMWSGISGAFRGMVNSIIGMWNGLSFSLPSVNVPGIGQVGGFTLSTPNIPYLAKGGIVKARPGGTLAVLGEAGRDEAVVPLPAGGRFGGGGGPEEIHARIDLALDGKVIQTVLLKHKRRMGGAPLGIA